MQGSLNMFPTELLWEIRFSIVSNLIIEMR